jgi:hypothetical protein
MRRREPPGRAERSRQMVFAVFLTVPVRACGEPCYAARESSKTVRLGAEEAAGRDASGKVALKRSQPFFSRYFNGSPYRGGSRKLAAPSGDQVPRFLARSYSTLATPLRRPFRCQRGAQNPCRLGAARMVL